MKNKAILLAVLTLTAFGATSCSDDNEAKDLEIKALRDAQLAASGSKTTVTLTETESSTTTVTQTATATTTLSGTATATSSGTGSQTDVVIEPTRE